MDIYDDLQEALSESLLGKPYSGEETLPEITQIDGLVFKAREYAIGHADLDELVAAYQGVPFDIRDWVSTMETQGEFTPSLENTNAP